MPIAYSFCDCHLSQAICRATAAPRWNCPRSHEVRCVKGCFWALHIWPAWLTMCSFRGLWCFMWLHFTFGYFQWFMMWLHITWPRPKKGFIAWQKIIKKKRMSTWIRGWLSSTSLQTSHAQAIRVTTRGRLLPSCYAQLEVVSQSFLHGIWLTGLAWHGTCHWQNCLKSNNIYIIMMDNDGG